MSKIKTNRESIPGITLSFDRATFIEWLLTGFDKEPQIFSLMGESLQKFRDQMGAAGLLREKIDQDSEIWKMLGERARKLAGESPEKKRQLCEQVADQVEASLGDWVALGVARARMTVVSNGLDATNQNKTLRAWLGLLFTAIMKDESQPLNLVFLAGTEQATDWIMSHAVEPGTAKDDVKAGKRAVRYFREMVGLPPIGPGRPSTFDNDTLIREYERTLAKWQGIKRHLRMLIKTGIHDVTGEIEREFNGDVGDIINAITNGAFMELRRISGSDRRLKKCVLDWRPSDAALLETGLRHEIINNIETHNISTFINRIKKSLRRARKQAQK